MDEINFTKRSFQSTGYSGKGENLTVDQERLYTGYHSAVVTVSAEEGIERYDIYSKAVDAPQFAKHLRKVRTKNGDRPLAILMDQLNVHSDKVAVRHLYDELNIEQILNIGYSPEFNCIEACFS